MLTSELLKEGIATINGSTLSFNGELDDSTVTLDTANVNTLQFSSRKVSIVIHEDIRKLIFLHPDSLVLIKGAAPDLQIVATKRLRIRMVRCSNGELGENIEINTGD